MATFGEKLRQQREERGISLDAISKTTKISTRLLRALEEERFDQLPGGVFNKGFVRAYARQVGLNEEETLGDYHAALRESLIQEEKILYDVDRKRGGNGTSALKAIERRKQSRRGSERRKEDRRDTDRQNADRGNTDRHNENRPLESRGKSASGVKDEHATGAGEIEHRRDFSPNIFSVNIDSTNNSSVRHRPDSLAPEPRELPQKSNSEIDAFRPRDFKDDTAPASPAKDLPVLEHVAGNTAVDDTVSHPVNDLPIQKTPASATPPGFWISRSLIAAVVLILIVILALWRSRHRAESGASPQPAAASVQTSLAMQPTALPAAQSHAATPGASTAAAITSAAAPTLPKIGSRASAAPSLGPFTLIIRADKNTSIAVLADGESVAHETLIAPAATSVHASHDVIVKAGNGAAISFLLNGKLIRPDANDGDAKTFVLNSNGLIGAPQPPAPNP